MFDPPRFLFLEETTMAIVVNHETKIFVGRVLKVKNFVARRNMSDTLDYTDSRKVECCEAFVWLGTHAVPPTDHYGKPTTTVYSQLNLVHNKPRELAMEEQFAWIDCSNHFVWRGSDHLVPTVDETIEEGALKALPVWESHQKFLAEEHSKKIAAEKAKQEEQDRINAEKEAIKAAKKAAKLESSKSVAEADFARLPAKGTVVSIGDSTGILFWSGIKAYRGQYTCRVGVKDNKGNVEWGNAKDLKVDSVVTEKEASSSEVQNALTRLKAAM